LNINEWCEANGYTDPYKVDGKWWAFADGAVMAVPVDYREPSPDEMPCRFMAIAYHGDSQLRSFEQWLHSELGQSIGRIQRIDSPEDLRGRVSGSILFLLGPCYRRHNIRVLEPIARSRQIHIIDTLERSSQQILTDILRIYPGMPNATQDLVRAIASIQPNRARMDQEEFRTLLSQSISPRQPYD
jgi:hypothetical protein